MADLNCKLTPICHIRMVSERPSELIGPTPTGLRVNFFISRGEVSGERLRGIVRPLGCADWALIRPDDVVEADVRLTIETHDGALIYMTYAGVALLGDGGSDRLQRGERPPEKVPLRVAGRMTTGHPEYNWLNRFQLIGVGTALNGTQTQVDYDIYAME